MKKFLIIVFAALLSVCAYSQTEVSVRVMSMNLKEGGKPGNYDVAKYAAVINDYKPDFVSLQELHDRTLMVLGKAWLAELGKRVGMYPVVFDSFDYNGGTFGVGILSRYPFYSMGKVVYNSGLAEQREPRATGWVSVMLPDGGNVRFAATHLPVENNDLRVKCIAAINKEIFAENSVIPTIIAGDFNAEPGSDVMKYAGNRWKEINPGAGNTLPAGDNPKQQYDFVLGYPKTGWSCSMYEILNRADLSDHCFVVADVNYKEK